MANPSYTRQQIFQKSFEDFFKNHEQGKGAIFAGFGDAKHGRRGLHQNNPAGDPQIEDPALPPVDPNGGGGDINSQYWRFPQYTQTWAFTPPAPTPYPTPQPFDPNKYGNPFAKKNK